LILPGGRLKRGANNGVHMAKSHQLSILLPPPDYGCSVTFQASLDADPKPALAKLRKQFDPRWGVAGFGEPLTRSLGCNVPGLRAFPAVAGSPFAIPSTQQALWFFLRASSRGEVFDLAAIVTDLLEGGFEVADKLDTFLYAGGRDLTGYEDGTANPDADESIGVAIAGKSSGAAGSSFVAVQRWVHDLRRFKSHPKSKRDAIVGRRLKTNEEIEDAPESAHVKRAAQELFEPTAFMVRRSQPWASGNGEGLEFIAYGSSFDAFERVLRRMAGVDDGIADALLTFSRPVTGGYYWCPPQNGKGLDLSLIGL
jgi:porphyrinogen peroxidase